jgi:hypothetical protein
MTRYYVNVHTKGQMFSRDVPGSLGVIESPDEPMLIGQIDCRTHDEHGVAVWVLSLGFANPGAIRDLPDGGPTLGDPSLT